MDDIQKENIRRLRDFATKVLVDAAAADLAAEELDYPEIDGAIDDIFTAIAELRCAVDYAERDSE